MNKNVNQLSKQEKYYADCCDLYNNSFVYLDGFEDKQFDRYVKRVKIYIYDTMKFSMCHVPKDYEQLIRKEVFNLFYFLLIENQEMFKKADLEKFQYVKNGLRVYNNHKNISNDVLKNKRKITYKYRLSYDNWCLESPAVMNSILSFFDIPKHKGELLELIEEETRNVCKDYIRKYAIVEFDGMKIEKSNYFKTLPQNILQAYEIFIDIVNRVALSIENLFARRITKEDFNFVKDSNNKEFQNEIKRQMKMLEEQEKQIKKDQDEIKRLQSLLCQKEMKIKEINSCKKSNDNEYVDALKRENNKLKSRYQSLLDKYNALKAEHEGTYYNAQEIIQIDELEVLDYDKNYMFVMYENTGLKSQILEKFKNANFIETNRQMKKFDARQIDCVIILTSHVGHDMYYKIKEKCKAKNIPMIHCNNFNIDLIEQLLINKMCY